jgi:hypothetical protein
VLIAELEHAEWLQRTEEGATRARYTEMRRNVDGLEAGLRAAGERDIQAIQSQLDQELQRLTTARNRLIEEAERELAAIDTQTATERKSWCTLRWDKGRAAAQVRAHDSLSFCQYLRHIALGTREVG